MEYSSANDVSESAEINFAEYESTTANENALSISGAITVSVMDTVINKTGDSDGGDNTSFYGINSALIAKDGALLSASNLTVSTDAVGANGIFCYGGFATTGNTSSDGTTVYISDSQITTNADDSGGIMTAGGGIMNAANLTVTTAGMSSAAIRTDRGGGTVTVDGGAYTTTGAGSPAVYSTADITVNNAELTAEQSEGIVVEGANSVTILNCDVTDSNTKLSGLSTTHKNIFLYQSMSGDAAEGSASFTATDSTITTNNGDSFYVTNTTCQISLTNNTIVNNDSSGCFLRAQADSWGSDGSNGGDVTLILSSQSVNGDIVIDSVSSLAMEIAAGSYFEGAINSDNTAPEITLTLDADSAIKLTGDSYITELSDADADYSNIDFNGYTLYVNGTAVN
ncbi:MAG: right-handed parallel beta-helix repeat-containing protein [Clostridiales bacterium]|nr:right-handed parallel beta-helix repeat-containing protein [Clostridiales bacterium]